MQYSALPETFVKIIRARSSYTYQFQVPGSTNSLLIDLHLIDDNHICVLYTIRHFLRLAASIADHFAQHLKSAKVNVCSY